jgi:hypothetical protein
LRHGDIDSCSREYSNFCRDPRNVDLDGNIGQHPQRYAVGERLDK